jgi:hypothetical protein
LDGGTSASYCGLPIILGAGTRLLGNVGTAWIRYQPRCVWGSPDRETFITSPFDGDCESLQPMTPDQFLDRCKFVCHVGPIGIWEQIAKHGFRTAEQLILESDLSEDERQRLLSTPRRESIRLSVKGGEVLLRDQGPLFARKNLTSVLGDGLDVSDWVRLLNRRVFFFTDQLSMQKLRDKYIELDGAQEVIWLSPLRVIRMEGLCLELTNQNSGAIARRRGPQKMADTFVPFSSFPNRKPKELTMVNGLNDLTPIVRAERHFRDGHVDRIFP